MDNLDNLDTQDNEDLICDKVYEHIYDNFDEIIKNEKVKKYLSESNNLLEILRKQNSDFSDKEIYCQALTVLHFILKPKWLKD